MNTDLKKKKNQKMTLRRTFSNWCITQFLEKRNETKVDSIKKIIKNSQ